MGRGKQIRSQDLRELLDLAGELSEIPHEDARLLHMLRGLGKLVDSRVLVWVRMNNAYVGSRRQTEKLICIGMEQSEQRKVEHFFQTGHPADPAENAFFARPNPGSSDFIVGRREQLVSDADWYASEHCNEIRKPLNVDHHVYTARRSERTGVAHSMGVHRDWNAKPFNAREQDVIHRFHIAVSWMYRQPRSPLDVAMEGLSPRLQDVLRGLLAGMGEKQISARLNLSQHTVHDHVKRLYAHLGVSSRGELLSKFIS
jgi:DNA-binding CsgD family transcriptional regulator